MAPQLAFLHGLRGLAAVMVLLHHTAYELDGEALPAWLAAALAPLRCGKPWVGIFIVLSGYCLMLPVVRSADGGLRGGLVGYLGRRARRIVPPYYAMLGISLLLIAAVGRLPLPRSPRFDVALPAFRPDVLVSHLLLVHNLRPQWIHKIDPPMWSVAVEWQIYFVFPVLLLLRRRWGTAAAVLGAFVVGYGQDLAGPLLRLLGVDATPVGSAVLRAADAYGRCGAPFLALFALGMAGAVIAHANDPRARRIRERLPWDVLALKATVLVALQIILAGEDGFLVLPLLGLAALALLVGCGRRAGGTVGSWPHPRALLELRPCVWLGTISYSLYLVHYPVLAVSHRVLMAFGFGAAARLGVLMLVVAPVSVGLAYLFHCAFERPFLAEPVRARPRVITDELPTGRARRGLGSHVGLPPA